MIRYEYKVMNIWYNDIAENIMREQEDNWEYVEQFETPVMGKAGSGVLFRREIKFLEDDEFSV